MSTQAPFMRMELGPSSLLGILDRVGWWGALGMIAIALVYTLFMLLVSRAPRVTADPRTRTRHFSSSSSCPASTRRR